MPNVNYVILAYQIILIASSYRELLVILLGCMNEEMTPKENKFSSCWYWYETFITGKLRKKRYKNLICKNICLEYIGWSITGDTKKIIGREKINGKYGI